MEIRQQPEKNVYAMMKEGGPLDGNPVEMPLEGGFQ